VSNTATIQAVIPAGAWSADPVHSNLTFELPFAGVNTFRGGFRDFSATVTGGDTPSVAGTANVASVDVKDEQLSGHLQTPDFFDSARYPQISFRATALRRLDDGQLDGTGDLTLKGVTLPVALRGTVAAEPSIDPFGRERLGLRLEATVDRTQFGVSWNAPNQGGGDYLGNDVKVIAELALVKQEA
jgi:polyisoprenoid-binding protein YceI